jgi:hypothetical protein
MHQLFSSEMHFMTLSFAKAGELAPAAARASEIHAHFLIVSSYASVTEVTLP